MTRAYFVSDLHLTTAEDPRSRLFERFLGDVARDRHATHLFLLGDIFDLWIGSHDYFVQRFQAIVGAIGALSEHGVEVHYFEGNHDLHLRRFWEEKLGVKVHSGPISVDVAGRRLRLEHGDQMDPDDRGYIFLRWFLRTPLMRLLILNLPGRLVAWIGERASMRSRTYTSEKKTLSSEGAIAKIRRHASKTHAEAPFDLMITGHVHVRDDTEIESSSGRGRSINLGTWLDLPCCFVLDEDEGRLFELDDGDMAQLRLPAEAVASNQT